MTNDFVNIGERIELRLKELNLKRMEICKKTGISKNAISNYINNNRVPDTLSCYKISKALSVSMEWLLTGKDYDDVNILVECKNNNEHIDINGEKSPNLHNNAIVFNCNQEEKNIIYLIRNVSDEDRKIIFGLLSKFKAKE